MRLFLSALLALGSVVALWLALAGGGARSEERAEHTALSEREWSAIQEVIDDQLRALRRGDAKSAYAHASTPLKVRFANADEFMTMVRSGYNALLTARTNEFLEGAVIDGAVMQPLRLILPDDTVLVALYRMEKEQDGAWHIAGCVIARSTVQST
ncbi:MAG TPA: DUF4864 domain-containing protein [Casimicrobiaceae bacterium]|nr:DUF4864 domain-containing protein [Casimicrobiaceae bacterium]